MSQLHVLPNHWMQNFILPAPLVGNRVNLGLPESPRESPRGLHSLLARTYRRTSEEGDGPGRADLLPATLHTKLTPPERLGHRHWGHWSQECRTNMRHVYFSTSSTTTHSCHTPTSYEFSSLPSRQEMSLVKPSIWSKIRPSLPLLEILHFNTASGTFLKTWS